MILKKYFSWTASKIFKIVVVLSRSLVSNSLQCLFAEWVLRPVVPCNIRNDVDEYQSVRPWTSCCRRGFSWCRERNSVAWRRGLGRSNHPDYCMQLGLFYSSRSAALASRVIVIAVLLLTLNIPLPPPIHHTTTLPRTRYARSHAAPPQLNIKFPPPDDRILFPLQTLSSLQERRWWNAQAADIFILFVHQL